MSVPAPPPQSPGADDAPGTLRVVAAGYLAFAILVLLPSWARGGLVGHPDVDVWNHAWGYWWFWDSLRELTPPFHTRLLGAPQGGTLYYIDPVGAIAALPITALFGAQAAWNTVLVLRLALAGWATHGLCRAVTGPGPHAWVAGIAVASAPTLWGEVANGISEVVDVGWVSLALWAAVRLEQRPDARRALGLGLALGAATLACFYYGLLAGLLCGGLLLGPALRGRVPARQLLLALAVAGALAAPGLGLLHHSVSRPDALISRAASLNLVLLRHNAVDPRDLVWPGAGARVDFAATYGEAFVHTLYLRWSLLGLAAAAVWRLGRPTWVWAALGLGSAVLGLGVYLWWGGDWVRPGGRLLLLPFGVLQAWVPALAVTHPARLGWGAVVVGAVLAAWGLRGRGRWAWGALPLLVAETVLASPVDWPLPSSPAAIPPLYSAIAADPDPRAVLDLPANVGGTMASSRYFWYQTVHRHPVPWFPDARGAQNGDVAATRLFERPPQAGPPPALTAAGVAHLRQRYAYIVLHPELADRLGTTEELRALLAAGLGEPTRADGRWVWRLAPPDGPAGAP